MKRYKDYILSLVALLLAACGDGYNGIIEPIIGEPGNGEPSNPISTIPSDNKYPIEFTASIDDDADTRAMTITYPNATNIVYGLDGDFHDGIEDNHDLKQTGFGVYGFYTGTTAISDTNNDGVTEETITNPWERQIVMKNQQVFYDAVNDIWKYNSLHYWPENNTKMSFFAYAPYAGGTDLINATSTTTKHATDNYYYFNDKVRIPLKKWEIDDQEDLVWGYDADTKLPYKNISRLDTKNKEGKLHWLFKHALARVKFSIFNFKDILDAYNDVATGIPTDTPVPDYQGGSDIPNGVGLYNSGTTLVSLYDGDNPALRGYYINLFEKAEGQKIWHKFDNLGSRARLLIITGVTFKNLVTDATLSYDNTTQTVEGKTIAVPNWIINEKSDAEHPYTVPTSVLNPLMFKDESEFASINFNSVWDNYPSVSSETLPLTTPGNETGKTHYFLMVPNTENLEITIKYRIISRYSLRGTYLWEGTNIDTPVAQVETTPFLMTGVTGNRSGEDTSITADIDKLFEANHSYHVSIRLGKMMQVLFEVTDWDDAEEPIIINVPSFE